MSRHLGHLRGKGAHEMIHAEYDKRLAEWDKFKDLSEEAHGELPVA
jgi:hypothetical protein